MNQEKEKSILRFCKKEKKQNKRLLKQFGWNTEKTRAS